VKETSLTSYVLGGVLTPLALVAAVWTLKRKVSPTIQWLAAGAASFLVNVGVVLAAYTTGT
jgi:hypothetical protein